jgi:hypothetical protein
VKIDYKNSGMETFEISNFDFRNNDGLAFKPIPLGTFAGTIERLVLVRNGEIVPSDTGDQGGGQN